MRQNFSIFSGAGKFCLAHGLRQLSLGDTISDVSWLQTLFTRRKENFEWRSELAIVNCLFKPSIFPMIGKKKWSVSDEDREIPTLRLMDNAGNEVYRVSGIIR